MKSTAKHRILLELMTHVEAPLDHLMRPEIGGTSADRRLRELRERGFNITYYYQPDKEGKPTRRTIYVLKNHPKQIDFKNLRVI
jgi:hypothetical protein